MFVSPIADWEPRLMELEERLDPIAKRPVDITDPEWMRKLRQSPHPFDAARVRAGAEALLDEVIDEYQKCGHDARRTIRELFAKYRAFAWAASLSSAPVTDSSFRRHLVLFSIKDQGTDGRDAILWLQHLCRTVTGAGVSPAPILREVAELSSDADRYGMGSTRKLLLGAASRGTR